MRLFDSHVHLLDARFGSGAIRSEMLRRARFADVEGALVPAVNPHDWDSLNMHFFEYDGKDPACQLRFALGIHPHALASLDPSGDQGRQDRLQARLAAGTRDIVAVGECGLDYSLEVDRARQQAVLISQIKLAASHALPLILHCVRAHDDLLRLLHAHGAPPSVVHGFTGSAETARRWIAAGHLIGIGGAITRPNIRRLRGAVCAIPDDRLLVETDAPDQTPFARRPAHNEPAFLIDVVESIAALRGVDAATIARITWRNADRLFGPLCP